MILASCSLKEALDCNGKVLSGNDKVYFNIEVSTDELESALKELDSNRSVYSVTVTDWGGDSELPDLSKEQQGKVYAQCNYDTAKVAKEGYITYVVYPEGYCNMKEVLNTCLMGDNVRVTGGNFLGIPSVRVGRTDVGKEKMSITFNKVYDTFLEIKLSEIDNLEVIKSKVSKRDLKVIEGTSNLEPKPKKSSGGTGSKTTKSLKESFSRLFDEEEVDF